MEIRGWTIKGFDETEWELLRNAFEQNDDIENVYGQIMKGSLCFDLVMYDDGPDTSVYLCADAYILGVNDGYGYTIKGTPYTESDGVGLEVDITKSYDEILYNFIEQIERFTYLDKTWNKASQNTEFVWAKEEE